VLAVCENRRNVGGTDVTSVVTSLGAPISVRRLYFPSPGGVRVSGSYSAENHESDLGRGLATRHVGW